MAILPINSVSVRTNQNKINFGAKTDDNSEDDGYEFPRRDIRKAATVPVVVMMSMTPSLLNAATAEKFTPLNTGALTEIVAENPTKETEAATYVMAPQQSGGMSTFQSEYFRQHYYSVFKMAAGNGAYLSFTPLAKDDEIGIIDYVPRNPGKHYSISSNSAATVQELVVHDLGDDNKDFCGIWTVEIQTDANGKERNIRKEYRLSNEAANEIIDLVSGDSKFKNRTGIKVTVVHTPDLRQTVVK